MISLLIEKLGIRFGSIGNKPIGTNFLLWDDGDAVLWDDGDKIIWI